MKSIRIIILFLTIVLFFSSRLIFIDKDVPPADVSSYAQLDEMMYAGAAMDFLQYGDPFYKMPGAKVSNFHLILGSQFANMVAVVTLKIWGNNYWGLRTGPLIVSILILILLWRFLELQQKEITDESGKEEKKFWFIKLLLLLLLITEHYFLFSNFVFENTIFRMAVMLLAMLALHKFLIGNKNSTSPIKYFLLGVIGILAWLFVYLTNAFIPFSIFVILFIYLKFNKAKIFKPLLYFLAGSIAGFLIFYCYAIIMHADLYYELTYLFNSFADRSALDKGTGATGFLKSCLINIFNLLHAGFTNFNPLLFFFFLSSFLIYPVIIFFDKKERKISISFIAFIVLCCFFIQSIFVNDFFTRKLIIIFPLYILIAHKVLLYVFKQPAILKKTIVKLILLFTFLLVVVSQETLDWLYQCSGNDIYRTYIHPSILALGGVGLIVGLCFLFRKKQKIIFVTLGLFIAINIYYTYYFNFRIISSDFKLAMQDMGKWVDGKYMVGGISPALRLYNTSLPGINFYSYYNLENAYMADMDTLIKENKADYIVAIKGDWLIKKFDLIYIKQILDVNCTGELGLYKFPD